MSKFSLASRAAQGRPSRLRLPLAPLLRRGADRGAVCVALLLLLWLTRGCETSSGGSAAVCNPEQCPCKTADPTEHCIRLAGCRDDGDCPAGTICVPSSPADAALVPPFEQCVVKRYAPATRCKLAAGGPDRALIDGFRVNEFSIEPIADTSAFAFAPPPEARFIACAFFGCRPDIRLVATDVEGVAIGEIVNYDECALSGAPQVFTISAQSGENSGPLAFTPSVDGSARPSPPDVCPGAAAIEPSTKRRLTELSVGCWAYDSTQLVAATRLAPVLPAQASAVIDELGPGCPSLPGQNDSDRTMGGPCFLTMTERPLVEAPLFGSCFGGTCRPRCITAADCPEALPTKDCPQPIAACIHDTERSFVGVCGYEECDRSDLVDAGTTGQAGGAP